MGTIIKADFSGEGKGRQRTAPAGAAAKVYQLRIELCGTNPPIWRRVLVQGDTTLADLHWIIQASMGWGDEHLHVFKAKGRQIAAANPLGDSSGEGECEEDITLAELAPRARMKFGYEYDFGDSWTHEIRVEATQPANAAWDGQPVCVAGERACPPEDCGGLWSYYDLTDALADPKHERHGELKEIWGDSLNPEAFDLEKANRRLRGEEALGAEDSGDDEDDDEDGLDDDDEDEFDEEDGLLDEEEEEEDDEDEDADDGRTGKPPK